MNFLFRPITAVLILMFFALGASGYFFFENQKTQKELKRLKTNPVDIQEAENKTILEKLNKLVLLPSNEKPTIATIANKEQLAVNQPFFASSKNGDKLIVYMQAKKAIIYDPVANKIIDIGPIVITSPTPTPGQVLSGNDNRFPANTAVTPSPSVAPAAATNSQTRIALYNSTSVPNLTVKFEPELLKIAPGAKIVDRGNAKSTYAESLLVDYSGGRLKDLVSNLSAKLKLKISALPIGEPPPLDTDLLVILGSDKSNL